MLVIYAKILSRSDLKSPPHSSGKCSSGAAQPSSAAAGSLATV